MEQLGGDFFYLPIENQSDLHLFGLLSDGGDAIVHKPLYS